MRVLLLLDLGAALAVQATAAPAAEPVSWPDRGPYREVGDGREYESVKMPVPVVEFLREMLLETPAEWWIEDISHRSGYRERVVEVTSTGREDIQQNVCLLVDGGQWVNLRAPENVPLLNDVVPPFRPDGLQNEGKLEGYLQSLIYLHANVAHLLTKEFPPLVARVEPVMGGTVYERWYHGSAKLRRALAGLRRNPQVSRGEEPKAVTVGGNVVRMDGSVERWTFHLRVEKMVTLERIDIAVLYQRGTFVPVF